MRTRKQFFIKSQEVEQIKGEEVMSGMVGLTNKNKLSRKGLITMAIAASLFFAVAVPSPSYATVLWTQTDNKPVKSEIKEDKMKEVVDSFFVKSDDDKISGLQVDGEKLAEIFSDNKSWNPAQWMMVMKEVALKSHEEFGDEFDAKKDEFFKALAELDAKVFDAQGKDIFKKAGFMHSFGELFGLEKELLESEDADKFLTFLLNEKEANRLGMTLAKKEEVSDEPKDNGLGEQTSDNSAIKACFDTIKNQMAQGLQALSDEIKRLGDLPTATPPAATAEAESDILKDFEALLAAQNAANAKEEELDDNNGLFENLLANLGLDEEDDDNGQGVQADPGQQAQQAPVATPPQRRERDEDQAPEVANADDFNNQPFVAVPSQAPASDVPLYPTQPLVERSKALQIKSVADNQEQVKNAIANELTENDKMILESNKFTGQIVQDKLNAGTPLGNSLSENVVKNRINATSAALAQVDSSLSQIDTELKTQENNLASLPSDPTKVSPEGLAALKKLEDELQSTTAKREQLQQEVRNSPTQELAASLDIENRALIAKEADLRKKIGEQQQININSNQESKRNYELMASSISRLKTTKADLASQKVKLNETSSGLRQILSNAELAVNQQFQGNQGINSLVNNRTGAAVTTGTAPLNSVAGTGPRSTPGNISQTIQSSGSRSGSYKRGAF